MLTRSHMLTLVVTAIVVLSGLLFFIPPSPTTPHLYPFRSTEGGLLMRQNISGTFILNLGMSFNEVKSRKGILIQLSPEDSMYIETDDEGYRSYNNISSQPSIEEAKPALKVALLGYADTWGWRIPPEKTFAHLLKLNSKGQIVVKNCSSLLAGHAHRILEYSADCQKFDPDWVVLQTSIGIFPYTFHDSFLSDYLGTYYYLLNRIQTDTFNPSEVRLNHLVHWSLKDLPPSLAAQWESLLRPKLAGYNSSAFIRWLENNFLFSYRPSNSVAIFRNLLTDYFMSGKYYEDIKLQPDKFHFYAYLKPLHEKLQRSNKKLLVLFLYNKLYTQSKEKIVQERYDVAYAQKLLDQMNIPYVDLKNLLLEEPSYFSPDSIFLNESGHLLVASLLEKYLFPK